VDAVAPGIAVVVGHMVDPHPREPDRVRFPFAQARYEMATSNEAKVLLDQLKQFNPETWVMFSDADVVSLVNPYGGNTRSVLEHYTQAIRASRRDGGQSSLVRLGGSVDFSVEEIVNTVTDANADVHEMAVDGEATFAAKLTMLIN